MISFIIFLFLLVPQEPEVPYKVNEDFKLDIQYQFKVRPMNSNSSAEFEAGATGGFNRKYNDGGQLPYLVVNFSVLKLSEGEVRVKVVNNKGGNMLNKKVEAGAVFKLDLGYTDDMKDRVTANEFDVLFLSSDKKPISLVRLTVQEDGTFIVNSEVRGKF